MSNKEIQQEGLFTATENFLNSFFDGLKTNTINKALEKAKQHPDMPSPVVDKMVELEKISKELKRMTKQLKTLKK